MEVSETTDDRLQKAEETVRKLKKLLANEKRDKADLGKFLSLYKRSNEDLHQAKTELEKAKLSVDQQSRLLFEANQRYAEKDSELQIALVALNSAKAHNAQLLAGEAEHAQIRRELQQSVKELARTKKLLVSKEEQLQNAKENWVVPTRHTLPVPADQNQLTARCFTDSETQTSFDLLEAFVVERLRGNWLPHHKPDWPAGLSVDMPLSGSSKSLKKRPSANNKDRRPAKIRKQEKASKSSSDSLLVEPVLQGLELESSEPIADFEANTEIPADILLANALAMQDQDLAVSFIQQETRNSDQAYFEDLLNVIQDLLFAKLLSMPSKTDSLSIICFIFGMLCCEHGIIQRARVLVFDLLRFQETIDLDLLLPIAQSWPAVFQSDTPLMSAVHYILEDAMQELASTGGSNSSVQTQVQKYHQLCSLCNWSTVSLQVDECSLGLLQLIGAPGNNDTFNLLKALELLAWYCGWVWTFNTLILSHLWPMLQSSLDDQKFDLAGNIVKLLGQLGCLAPEDGPEGSSGIGALKIKLRDLLDSPIVPDGFFVHICAAQALLCLSQSASELESLRQWYRLLPDALKVTMAASIEQDL
eukprot:TRINITY_DN15609_c0_g1_i1.p1 TRINITY_DN15609_c0_g1~~TRINITY_DN15609_c0_g1_i1.p1  ORF type:complete len:588 (-),score=-40.09 TRINITY_DN15609_c0_g1_i1:46-1809(-)